MIFYTLKGVLFFTMKIDFLDYISPPKVIYNGTICKMNGESIPYAIELGLDKSSILECNKWKDFIANIILAFIEENPDVNNYKKTLQNDILLEDYHWNWSKKAFVYNKPGYDWFFLKTYEGIQGVCLTFHPRKSVFQSVNIFYIHYLASAPWNRKSSLHDRQYKGVGIEILKQIQFYFIRKYKYNYGFSLHSLPQSCKFYESIGMKNLSEYNDENGLLFYELGEKCAISFMEVKNAKN
jgi:hypothetical protein